MTWTKFSDDFSDDCWTLSDAAFRLHVEGLVWSNRKLLDLELDKDEVRRWAKHPEAAEELLATGWWKDEGDHYLIVHHAAYQRDRDQVLAQQEANQKNGKKGGRPPGPPRERVPRKRRKKGSEEPRRVTHSLTETETEWVSEQESSAVPETHSLSDSPTERDRTGQDRPGGGESGTNKTNKTESVSESELPLAAGAEDIDVQLNGKRSKPRPAWRGGGPDPFEEYR